jgi:transformation/transcription domain-associated protein
MEVQEAFVKVQEQAKAYMLRPTEHLHGLNLINSTNMDYFQPPHQAEMICLKAQFLQLLNETDQGRFLCEINKCVLKF